MQRTVLQVHPPTGTKIEGSGELRGLNVFGPRYPASGVEEFEWQDYELYEAAYNDDLDGVTPQQAPSPQSR